MADTKISALSDGAAGVAATDIIPIARAGANYRLTLQQAVNAALAAPGAIGGGTPAPLSGTTINATGLITGVSGALSGGVKITGNVSALGGTFRTDTGIEIQGADAGLSLYQTSTAASKEAFIAYGYPDSAAGLRKSASVSALPVDATASTGFSVLRLNATYAGGASDSVFLRGWGNQGATFFGTSESDYPGAGILRVRGNVAATGTLSVTGTSTLTGGVGVGIAAVAYAGLYQYSTTIGATGGQSWGIFADPNFPSTTTSIGAAMAGRLNVANSAFTMTNGVTFDGLTATKGAAATVTNNTVFRAQEQTIGGTTNNGFKGELSSGSGKKNLNMTGTAENLLTGITTFGAQINLGSFTVGTLPSAATAGGMIYVSDAGGNGPCACVSNGTNWKRSDNASTTVT